MQVFIRAILALAIAVGISGCSKFKSYDGPEVTRILVYKSSRQMYLMHEETVLSSYAIDLGFAPVGHKQIEGDGRTPEGSYIIDRRHPKSEYHLSLGINYPNPEDIEFATKMEKNPGGDIFIHGGPRLFRDPAKADWTSGCISVSNREIEEIYAMVKVGTPIDIFP